MSVEPPPVTDPSLSPPRELRDYQVAAVAAVEAEWDTGLQRTSVILPTGSGKALSDNTLVNTPSGPRLHGDLRVGDQVFGPDGRPRRITHTHPQGVIDVYRVAFSDRTTLLVSGDHLWQVTRRHRKPRVMSTLDLMATDLVDHGDGGMWKWRIPQPEPLRYPDMDTEVPPYIVGALLANGYLAGTSPGSAMITTPDKFVQGRVLAEYPYLRVANYGGCDRISLSGSAAKTVFSWAKKHGVDKKSADKFIPEPYFTGSVPQRIELLNGLIDCDGSSRSGGRRSLNYHSVSCRLAHDVQRLVWSLGGTAPVSSTPRVREYKGKTTEYTEYQVAILLPADIEGVTTPDKRRTETPRRVFAPHRSIVSIEPEGQASCQCITVDAEDGLYLAGEQNAVTHNSTVIAKLADEHRDKGVVMLAHRAELINQMAEAVAAVNPAAPPVGKVIADYDEPGAQIVAASFQTLSRSPERLRALGQRGVILVDECFVAGTLVDGQPIESLRAGDTVTAVAPDRSITRRMITATMRRVPSALVRVCLTDDQSIICTPEHPFLTGTGWTVACELKAGEDLFHADATETRYAFAGYRVHNIAILQPGSDGLYGGLCPDGHVYNLEVEGDHTYTVGPGVVVHNCHHSLADTYLKVLTDLGLDIDTTDLKTARESDVVRTGTRPDVVACGFTATMSRADSLRLGKVWHSVAFERDLVWGLDSGFLIPPVGKTIRTEALDKLASIRQVAGDYNKRDLEEVMTASVGTTVAGIIEHAQGRSILVFASSVEHARSLSASLTRAGVRAASVTGSDKEDRREAVYAAFRTGALDAMVTVQVLTEGADFPRCDAVVLARPTRSRVLLTQIIGRCVRPYTYPDGSKKTDALVLDLTGVVRDNKMVSLSDLWGEAQAASFTEDGEVFTPPPPAGPKKPKKQRVGRATVEKIDLYDRQQRYRNILWVTSPSGVVFMPGLKGREAYVLWPPNPATAENCNLLQLDANGTVAVFRGPDGTPVRATFEETVEAANDFALESKKYVKVNAGWRGGRRRPTSAQKDLASRLGVPIHPSDTSGALSDRISAAFIDRALASARIPAQTL